MANKKTISKKLSERTFLNQLESSKIIEEIFKIIYEEIKTGEEVTIVGFGKFYPYLNSSRPVRNLKTQEEMILKEYFSLRFKASKVVKEQLKKKNIKK